MITKIIIWCKTHNPKYAFRWFKKLAIIVNDYDHDLIKLRDNIRACDLRISDGVNMIKQRTDIHADIHVGVRNSSQVIMIGRYRNADYIQTFDITSDDFAEMLKNLTLMEKYGVVRKVDAVPMIKATLESELKNWRI